MKKSIVVFCSICLSVIPSLQAQDSLDKKPSFHRGEFGLRFMPTISAFDMETSSGGHVKGEATLGYGIGAMLGFNFTNHVGMQAEILYNSLSQKYKDQDMDRELKVRYLNFPVLLSLNTGKANPVNLGVHVGPQLGFNLGSSMSSSGDTLITVLSARRSDFGFAYGAGLEFVLNAAKSIRLDLGFRGVHGLANISNTDTKPEDGSQYVLDRAKVRTKSIYMGITVLF